MISWIGIPSFNASLLAVDLLLRLPVLLRRQQRHLLQLRGAVRGERQHGAPAVRQRTAGGLNLEIVSCEMDLFGSFGAYQKW